MKKNKMLNILGLLAAFALLILSTTRCSKDDDTVEDTDYSRPEHWLSLSGFPRKPVDVFYLYPTTYRKLAASDPTCCNINNASMLKGSPIAFNNQATAFETAGNLYAPYYRQAALTPGVTQTEEEMWKVAEGIPYSDVSAAFDYFINNFNQGRPFILVGHSQGSIQMMLLLSRYMAVNPAVYSRMIAAYVIGYPVTAQYMTANPHLKFAEGPDDLGVIISYNTQSPNMLSGESLIMGTNIGIVINPINWKRDETLAMVSESLGSYMPDSTGVYVKVPAYADARINLAQGVLICSSVDEDALSGPVFGHGGYHMWDYPLYFYNLKENAENRVNKYFGK